MPTSNSSMTSETNASGDYHRLLNRIPESVPVISESEAKPKYDNILALLLRQPPEIRQLILHWLEATDLLKLRATSHSLHTLIHDSERSICLGLSEQISKTCSLSHLSMPIDNLSAFFTMIRSFHAIRDMSDVIALRICGSMFLRVTSTKEEVLKTVSARARILLQKKLTRSFIILQYYLNFLLRTMFDNEEHLSSLEDEVFGGLVNVFDLDQQKFLLDNLFELTESDFIDVTAAWNIFKSMCKLRHVSLNSRIFTFCSVSVKHSLLYDGFIPFASLLEKEATPPAQQAILQSCDEKRRRRNLTRDKYPLSSIQHLDFRKEVLKMDFDRRRSSKARESYISHQDIWDRASKALMMQKLGRYPEVKTSSEWIRGLVSSIEDGREVEIGTWATI